MEDQAPDGSTGESAGLGMTAKITPTRKRQVRQDGLAIDPRLATFTLATIYKVQGLYQQALQVLDLLQGKGADKERLVEERASIKKMMTRGYKPE